MDASVFVRQCEQAGIGFFCGVPDSIVGPLSSALTNSNASNHHIATHEGNAIGMALGYFAVSEEPALVYMQNSGLGNAVDPLTSLADKAVFGVPMVLLIGWRGEPGTDDEPQHEKPGAITLQLLELLGIESVVLTGDVEKDGELIMQMIELTKKLQSPVALVVKRGYFNTVVPKEVADEGLMREAVLKEIIASIPRDSVVVANIGKTSRELYELREATSTTHDRDLLIVGGMGHASSIALTIAKYSKLNKAVYCIDGDGSVLMHMGALASIGHDHTQLTHILLNNGVYDSVGGQPSGFNWA